MKNTKFILNCYLQKRLINNVKTLSEKKFESVSSKNNTSSDLNYDYPEIIPDKPKKPSIPFTSYNLAPYVNSSNTLTNLVKLGVDLSKLEHNSAIANTILKMDYNTVLEHILFFKDNLNLFDHLGQMITKCPEILTESIENMNVRILYLKSKLFSNESISIMLSKTPELLITPIKITDENIGFVQNLFNLDGKEIRHVISRLPKIIYHSRFALQENILSFDRFLGFTKEEIKSILIFNPRILISGKYAIQERFTFLQNSMGLSHEQILLWPTILRTRVSIIKPRHEFLVSLKKNQYERKIANYVSLQALAIGDDATFCSEVAKVSLELYNAFLKTL